MAATTRAGPVASLAINWISGAMNKATRNNNPHITLKS